MNIFDDIFVDRTIITTAGSQPGTAISKQDNYCSSLKYISVLPNTQYSFFNKDTLTFAIACAAIFYNANKEYISNATYGFNTGNNNTFTFETPSNCKFVRFTLRETGLSEEMTKIKSWQLNVGNRSLYVPPKQLRVSVEDIEVLNNTSIQNEFFCIENNVVKRYIDAVSYPDGDYSNSSIKEYENVVGFYDFDKPFPILIKWTPVENIIKQTVLISTTSSTASDALAKKYDVPVNASKIAIYNLTPNTKYYYKVMIIMDDGTEKQLKLGSFSTTNDIVRMLNIDGIRNVRDIGGWTTTDNKKLKYNLVYHGSEFDNTSTGWSISSIGKYELLNHVGIKSDIDLRAIDLIKSPLGDSVTYKNFPIAAYKDALTNTQSQESIKKIFEYLASQIKNNRPVYIHCQGGQDRTGTIIFLVEGVCGVSESDLAKEYELTEFSHPATGNNSKPGIARNYDNYKNLVSYIKTFEGDTFQEKIKKCLLNINVNITDIETIQHTMIN